MAKSDAERGPIALWARNQRVARGWTQAEVAEMVGLTELSYRGYEAGPRVSVPVRRKLEEIYGTTPPDPHAPGEQPTESMAELVAAIRGQTEAISRLATALENPESPEPMVPLSAVRDVVRQIVASAPDLAALTKDPTESHDIADPANSVGGQ